MKTILNNLNCSLSTKQDKASVATYHICNKDGSIRWIWSAKSKQPDFLNFYHNSGLKSKVFIFLMKLIFALRLQHLVFGNSKTFVNVSSFSPLHPFRKQEFFVFTGTVGPNRKYILLLKDHLGSFFKKWGINDKSHALIQNEVEAIKEVGQLTSNKISLPLHFKLENKDNYVPMEQFSTQSTAKFSSDHASVLKCLLNNTYSFVGKRSFYQKHDFIKRIKFLVDKGERNIPFGILHKLELLAIKINPKTIGVSWGHGDFTPWNMKYTQNQELYVYDWEMFKKDYPMFFDFFHFFFQNGTLVQHKSWKGIKADLKHNFENYFDESFHKDFQLYLDAYLMVNTLSQLELFENQATWHPQVSWLMAVWNEAMSESLEQTVSSKELLLADVYDYMHKGEYALLKYPEHNPYQVKEYSDIDICIQKSLAKKVIAYLKEHELVNTLKIDRWSYRTSVQVVLNNGGFLHLDFVHDFKRKHLRFLDIKTVLKVKFKDAYGIQYLSPKNAARYVALFYSLNGQTVPVKYKPVLKFLSKSEEKLDQILIKTSTERKDVQEWVMKQEDNRGLNALKHKIIYVLDTLKTLRHKKGFTVSFSGVDGAGKSTIISLAKQELEKKYRRRVVVLRHRPSILPILSALKYGKKKAEQKSVESLPRLGQNQSYTSSLFRFTYYYLDYLLGQFIIHFKHVLRGDIVLYDRYYFDFIHDSVRSNIKLPKWFLKFGFNFIFKPEHNFFLYADPAVILERKQELNYQEIERLNKVYLSHFKNLSERRKENYLAIKNREIVQTMSVVLSNVELNLRA